jgi:hypothetical protein
MKKATPKPVKQMFGIRFDPAVKKALERAAADDRRPVSTLVQLIVADWLKEKGYMK